MRTDMRRPFTTVKRRGIIAVTCRNYTYINGVTRLEKVNFQKSITYIMRLKLLYISSFHLQLVLFDRAMDVSSPPPRKLQGFGVFAYS